MTKRYHWVVPCFTVCYALHLTSGEKFNCSVSQNGNLMTFTISDESRASDVDTHDCDYSWSNGSNYIIADNLSHIPPVVKASIKSLTVSQCVEGIISNQLCSSAATGLTIPYIANCSVTCPNMDFKHGEGGQSVIQIVLGVLGAVGVVIVLFLCYKHRDKIWRKSSCGQCGGRYTDVKMQKIEHKPLEVYDLEHKAKITK